MGASVGPGSVVQGRYRLEELLGEGGFAVVHRATDLRSGAAVAVKLLLGAGPEVGARLRREAELAMRLAHPNTVRTLDAGEDPAVGPFLVMELLSGQSLDAHLRTHGRLAPRRVAEIGSAVLGALEEAHALGIVHRDVKPANVFLSRGGGPAVKILDFGVAKLVREEGRAGLTRDGQAVGTPAYMAPEQVTGGAVGPETDLYALGLLLAEALSGRPMFDPAAGLAILIDKLRPVALELPPEVRDSGLAQLVARALAPAREDRWRSAREMRAALELALSSMDDETLDGGSVRILRRPSAGWGAEQASAADLRSSSASWPGALLAEGPDARPTPPPASPPAARGSLPSGSPGAALAPTLPPPREEPAAPTIRIGAPVRRATFVVLGLAIFALLVGIGWIVLRA